MPLPVQAAAAPDFALSMKSDEQVHNIVPGADVPIAPPPVPVGMLPMLSEHGEVRPLQELENEIIRFAISHYRGLMSEVARRLKIGRSTLYRKLDDAMPQDSGTTEAGSRG